MIRNHPVVFPRARFRLVLTMLGLVLLVASCKESPKTAQDRLPDDSSNVGSVVGTDTPITLSKDLPTGRFQLPTAHTPAPDFWITLPKGYQIKYVGRMPNDEFYIFRSDDPSISDTALSSTGVVRIYIGVTPQTALGNGRQYEERKGSIGNYQTMWKAWSERLPNGGMYYQREIASDDFFREFSKELANAPLHLHLYVAGTDSTQVNELVKAIQTIGPRG